MNKKDLSERDICTKFITPAIQRSGWDLLTQIREEVTFTNGRVIVRGKLHTRGKQKRADYILYYKENIPIAIIEAKDNNHNLGDGMQQGLSYAEMLDIPFVFSSNGDGFLFHDKTGNAPKTESELALNEFPSPDELWHRYCLSKGFSEEATKTVFHPYHDDGSNRSPRYYQAIAINRTIEAVAQGQNRILLVMATGTGKTYTAFQIIYRLWKSKRKKRILFLADRNILVDQTKNNDFKPFGPAMTKVTKRQVNKSFEIYLSLYQAVTGNEASKNIYRQFTPDFFDLVVIDECHRGSALEDSAWREILDYFSNATHIGMTATPKEKKPEKDSNIVKDPEYNYKYFGNPIYTYSLKQGIEDGFLAPYKVIRIDIDKDLQGWRPKYGQTDKHGNVIEDRIYNQRDFDKSMVLEKRTELVAKKITEFLQKTDPYQKTIVFCDNIDHAERMRQALVNLNAQHVQENRKYIMRITGDEQEGKNELDNFIDPEERYPVIATTSKLMTTGVDAQTCKLIVLDQRILSPTEFKQIIGRGTRINEDYEKYWFTIMDFKKATELFADPHFDGEPIVIHQPTGGESPVPPEEPEPQPGPEEPPLGPEPPTTITGPGPPVIPPAPGGTPPSPVKKYYVQNVLVSVVAERVQYYGPDGRLITESLKDYTRACISQYFASLDEFLNHWTETDKKKTLIDSLAEQGVFWEALAEEVEKKTGKILDPFDLICHIVYDQPPLTRKERAEQVKQRNYFTKYKAAAQSVLQALIDKYADTGIENIEDLKILKIEPFNQIGTPPEIVKHFGGKAGYLDALKELEAALYSQKESA